MKLRLEREASAHGATIGKLFVDNVPECWILEDEVREKDGMPVGMWKIKGSTAIPRGVYNVTITASARFRRPLPLLENVPGFEGIRIHPGNTAENTEGCLLPGRGRSDHTVTESRVAFNGLYVKIQNALGRRELVSIEIV